MNSTCIGCGCDDQHACSGGCHWLRVDLKIGAGVCSSCKEFYLKLWDEGGGIVIKLAKVKFSTGTYTARIHQASGSCTSDARTAVERAAKRYADANHLSFTKILPGEDESTCCVAFERRQA